MIFFYLICFLFPLTAVTSSDQFIVASVKLMFSLEKEIDNPKDFLFRELSDYQENQNKNKDNFVATTRYSKLSFESSKRLVTMQCPFNIACAALNNQYLIILANDAIKKTEWSGDFTETITWQNFLLYSHTNYEKFIFIKYLPVKVEKMEGKFEFQLLSTPIYSDSTIAFELKDFWTKKDKPTMIILSTSYTFDLNSQTIYSPPDFETDPIIIKNETVSTSQAEVIPSSQSILKEPEKETIPKSTTKPNTEIAEKLPIVKEKTSLFNQVSDTTRINQTVVPTRKVEKLPPELESISDDDSADEPGTNLKPEPTMLSSLFSKKLKSLLSSNVPVIFVGVLLGFSLYCYASFFIQK